MLTHLDLWLIKSLFLLLRQIFFLTLLSLIGRLSAQNNFRNPIVELNFILAHLKRQSN